MHALREKLMAADGKCYVDVALWGGIVPGNQVSNRYFGSVVLIKILIDCVKT